MTSPSPLERLAGPGNVLAKEPPDPKEFAGLVRSGLARLKDAESETNSLDSPRHGLGPERVPGGLFRQRTHGVFIPEGRYLIPDPLLAFRWSLFQLQRGRDRHEDPSSHLA